jgi:hypothetical protein
MALVVAVALAGSVVLPAAVGMGLPLKLRQVQLVKVLTDGAAAAQFNMAAAVAVGLRHKEPPGAVLLLPIHLAARVQQTASAAHL